MYRIDEKSTRISSVSEKNGQIFRTLHERIAGEGYFEYMYRHSSNVKNAKKVDS